MMAILSIRLASVRVISLFNNSAKQARGATYVFPTLAIVLTVFAGKCCR
jgi:hypothetical protein